MSNLDRGQKKAPLLSQTDVYRKGSGRAISWWKGPSEVERGAARKGNKGRGNALLQRHNSNEIRVRENRTGGQMIQSER